MDYKEYLVVGAGGVGPAIAWWLLQQEDTCHVRIADKDYAAAQRAVDIASQGIDDARCECGPMSLDVTAKEKFVRNAFSGYDVVISAIPATHNILLGRLATEVAAHFCDLGGVLWVTQRMQRDLDALAKESGLAIVPDCGLMPGLGNMAAQHLLNELGGAHEITIYVGGIPQRPEPPSYYQRIFSLEGLMHILEEAPIVRDGKLRTINALEEYEKLWIPELERFGTKFGNTAEAFITAGAGTAPWWFQRQGVTNFCEKTVRWPGFVQLVRTTPRKELASLFEKTLPPTDSTHPDAVWLDVVARRQDGQEARYSLLDTYDAAHGFSAMARTTGFSAAVVARSLARGLVQPGVHAPEQLPSAVIEECLTILSASFKK